MKMTKKWIYGFSCVILLLGMSVFGTGCVASLNSSSSTSDSATSNSSSSLSENKPTSSEKLISESEVRAAADKIKLENKIVTYNGEKHSIKVTGSVPSYISITYVGNDKVNAGVHTVGAVLIDLSGNNLTLPALEATLTINKADLKVTFEDEKISYDGKDHSLKVKNDLPKGVEVKYTTKVGEEEVNNNQKKEGTYLVTASFKDTTGNYNVPEDITRTMVIVKDGMYKTIMITYLDGSTKELVIKDKEKITSLPIEVEEGYTGYYINQETKERIIFPYEVTENVNFEFVKVKLDFTYTLVNEKITLTGYTGNEKDLIIPQFLNHKEKTYPVTSIADHAFRNLDLTSVTMHEGITSIGYSAFRDCDKLTSIGYSFYDKDSKQTSVILPKTITSIGYEAFSNCSNLTSIVLPEGVTSILDSTFSGCSSLESIKLSSKLTSIGYEAFYNCNSLKTVIIPETVTSIDAYAFKGCSELTIYSSTYKSDSRWNANWNPDNRQVYWSNQWEYVSGVPTPINK